MPEQMLNQCIFLSIATIILGLFALWLRHEMRKELFEIKPRDQFLKDLRAKLARAREAAKKAEAIGFRENFDIGVRAYFEDLEKAKKEQE